jgi:hypothetical protein
MRPHGRWGAALEVWSLNSKPDCLAPSSLRNTALHDRRGSRFARDRQEMEASRVPDGPAGRRRRTRITSDQTRKIETPRRARQPLPEDRPRGRGTAKVKPPTMSLQRSKRLKI